MDNTETYIKMSRQAIPIQEKAEFAGGDFVYGFFDGAMDVIPLTCADKNLDIFDRTYDLIWLPRQDQLQILVYSKEQLEFPSAMLLDQQQGIAAFIRKETMRYFSSMEQLWLAFVMKEKYDKVWNGKGWIELPKKVVPMPEPTKPATVPI